MKKCYKCKQEKELNEFYNCKSQPDGKQQKCKECFKIFGKIQNERKHQLGIFKYYNHILSKEEKSQIVKEYAENHLSTKLIAEKFKTNTTTVLRLLKKNNIKIDRLNCQRKYKIININYFDNIDTEDRAYFLGLLWADGCNYKVDGKAHQIVIHLQNRDRHILEEFATKIYGDTKILSIRKKKDERCQLMCCFRIPNKYISDVLFEHGMVPRKSLIVDWPKNLPENMIKHFIRGEYDGDGGISYNSNSKNYEVMFIGSVLFISKLQNYLNKELNDNFSLKIEKKKFSVPMAYLRIHGNLKCKKFLDWLYDGAKTKLDRKYQRYLSLCELVQKLHPELGAKPA